MVSVFVEGYGCSLNKSDTLQIKGFLKEHGFSFAPPEKADFVIINTCAVKQATEFKMLKRTRQLFQLSKKHRFKIVVFGCLPEINPREIEKISSSIVRIGPSLAQLAEFFSLEGEQFSPSVPEFSEDRFIAILPICRGCLGECAFCAVKKARGTLKSYSIESLNKKFRQLTKSKKEVWLTAQDTGCFGKDIGASLIDLLRALLENKGDYRIRIGMMNPNHLKEMLPELIQLLRDGRVYLFLHVPLQSGSNRILKLMNRKYRVESFVASIKRLRKAFPDLTISTDIIVGFPTETERDFKKTLSVLKRLNFDIVNVSRYGKRPFTAAAKMQKQVFEWEKKRRSRLASALCRQISLKRNRRMLGRIERIFVNEKGKRGTFVGRTRNYKPVAIKQNLLGRFAKARIVGAFPTYLAAELQKRER